MKKQSLYILVVAVIILLGLTVVLTQREKSQVADIERGTPFFSNLEQRINDVTRLEITQNGETITLYKKGESWVLKERFDYYADVSNIKQLVLALSQLKIVEQKTNKPENYAKLGVQDPDATSNNKKITLTDANNNVIAELIVGNGKGNGSYVRKADDAQAWQVEGSLFFPGSITGWLDKTIAEITPDKISRVTLKNPKKESIVIEKAKPDDKDFTVTSPKPKGEIETSVVGSVVGALTRFQFDDVIPLQQLGGLNPSNQASYQITPSVALTVNLAEKDKKIYAWIIFDHADENAQKTLETSGIDVRKLRERLTPWAFEIAEFKAAYFKKSLSDLVKVSAGSKK